MFEKKFISPFVFIIILQLGIGLKGLSLPLIFKSQATFSGADIKILSDLSLFKICTNLLILLFTVSPTIFGFKQ